jgi:hypothetical protein
VVIATPAQKNFCCNCCEIRLGVTIVTPEQFVLPDAPTTADDMDARVILPEKACFEREIAQGAWATLPNPHQTAASLTERAAKCLHVSFGC